MYPTFSIIKNQSLSQYTTLEVGGTTDAFIQVHNEQTAIDAMHWANTHGYPIYFLGGGSNLLIDDQHLCACVLQLSESYTSAQSDLRSLDSSAHQDEIAPGIWRIDEDEQQEVWRIWAGIRWQTVVDLALSFNRYGIECLTGIPGKVGAAAIQNIGAYGQSFEEVGLGVESYHFSSVSDHSAQMNFLDAQQCQWSYRHSFFKTQTDHLILFVKIKLKKQDKIPINAIKYPQLLNRLMEKYPNQQHFNAKTIAQSVFDIRAEKSMIYQKSDPNHRSAGSFFTNPIVSDRQAHQVQSIAQSMGLHLVSWPDALGRKLSAAWLIEKSGCPAGYRLSSCPNVALSSKHSLCLINQGAATAKEIKTFSQYIQSKVKQTFGVDLSPEVVFWENEDLRSRSKIKI